MRILVVGGGVMGCATALELASRGAREIVVLERAVPGAEASSAAAGMLAAQLEAKDEAELDRYVRARDVYASWATELRERTGLDVGYKKSGALSLARSDAELAALDAAVRAQRARGLAAELVDARGARSVERDLGDGFVGAAHFPDEAQVEPPRLLRALAVAVSRANVLVRSGATVSTLVCEGGRCVGVSLDARELLRADAVVLAAGSWSSLVPGVPAELPRVRPIRGQLVELEERPPRLATILVLADHAYVVPRGDGRVVCGSTMEDVGHRREVTAAGLHGILGAAIAIAPRLGQAELVRSWNNFRPCAASGEPLVGASPLPGLYLATGHHRNGILLAQATAKAVADALFVT